MKEAITLILLSITIINSSKILNSYDNDNFSKCISKISNLFKQKLVLFFLKDAEHTDEVLGSFHGNGNLISVANSHTDEHYDLFVISIRNIKDFTKFVKIFRVNSKPRVVVLNYGASSENDEILKISWKYYIINIIILSLNKNRTEILSYAPYKSKDCHQHFNKFSRECGVVNFKDIFPNKIPTNFKGCVTNYGAYMFPPFVTDVINPQMDAKLIGLEIILLKTILGFVNSKPNNTLVSGYDGLGVLQKNGTIIGPLSNLIPHETDILFGHLWPNVSFQGHTDILYPFFADYTNWFVPRAGQLAKWKCLFVILEAKLWALIFITFLINSLIWWITAKLTNDIGPLQNMGQCILFGFYVLCAGASPQPNKIILRLLVINWTFYGLLIAVMYQSQLLTILTNPINDHQIKDIEELPTSNLEFISAKEVLSTIKYFPPEVHTWLVQTGKFVEIDVLMKKIIQYDRTFIFICTFYWMKLLIGTYYTNDDGSPMVYNLYDERYTTLNIPICMYTSKAFPLGDRINQLGFRLQAAGFFAKWFRDIDTQFYGKTSKDPVKLTLDHVAGGFFLWICGLVMSVTAFLGEIVADKFWKREMVFFSALY